MKKTSKLLVNALFVLGMISLFSSCKKVDSPGVLASNSEKDYSYGAIIVNEGTFGAGNGSLSYYSYSADRVVNNVFESNNHRPLGDVAQSITRAGAYAYICVNSSNKIEVVDGKTMKEVATITGINQPRYMVTNGNTGYVSCWNNGGEVKVIDLSTNTIQATIAVGSGPEKMIINNGNIYVPNSGGFGSDSTISVISLSSNTVVTTIPVNGYNPSAIVNGSGNIVWAIAKGKVIYDAGWNPIGHEPSKLIEINTSTNTIVSTTVLFPSDHPSNIEISPDGSTLYFGGSWGFPAIYSTSTASPSTPSAPLISEVNYGFFVNANNGNLFILQEASSANGKLLRYSPTGTKLGEYTVGIFPNGGSSRRAQ